MGHSELNTAFWMHNVVSPSISSWRGFAFEEVCMLHADKIKRALGISGVLTEHSAWVVKGDDNAEGGQIDLLIVRKDNIVNMREMKFYNDVFTVNKSYHAKLILRQNLLAEKIRKRQVIHNVLITTEGLAYNAYSGIFQNVVTIDDFFQ